MVQLVDRIFLGDFVEVVVGGEEGGEGALTLNGLGGGSAGVNFDVFGIRV